MSRLPLTPTVSLTRVNKLRLLAAPPSDLNKAVARLNAVGLHATLSRLEPGGILGGLECFNDGGIRCYSQSFLISPGRSAFVPSVAGPGNQSESTAATSLEEAVEWVIGVYRSRGLLIGHDPK